MNEEEENGVVWKKCRYNYRQYEVSNDGRVRSVDNILVYSDGSFNLLFGRELKTTVDRHGYRVVYLGTRLDGRLMKVHRLVAMLFLERPEPNKNQVNHKNGVRDYNWWENLEWVTNQENALHSKRVLLHNVGSQVYNAKLTEDIVREARRLHGEGYTHKELATRFGVTRRTIARAITGDTWKHVT